jgi:hypothetical protein
MIPGCEEVLGDKAWSGKPAVCIGGGPSIKGLKTDDLSDYKVIGANLAFTRFHCDVAFVNDPALLLLMKDNPSKIGWWKTRESPKIRLVRENIAAEYDGKCRFQWAYHVKAALSGWGMSFHYGVTHGFAGYIIYNIADVLGASQIFLLGYDMAGKNVIDRQGRNIVDGHGCHIQRFVWWHNYYPKGWHINIHATNQYANYIEEFDHVPEEVREKTYVVGDSKLEGFKKISMAQFRSQSALIK